MPKTPLSIRSVPCTACRRRKAACERDVQTDEPCRWCHERGLSCDAPGTRAAVEQTSARLANQDAEIRAQIARLEAVVQDLERRKSLTRKEASSDEEAAVAVDSLVADLHAIVIQDGSELEGEVLDPVLAAAKEQLGTQPLDLGLKPQEPILSFDELILRLPSPASIQLLLTSIWPTLLWFYRDDLYAPDYPLRVARNLAERTFDPGTLGELFANSALVHSALASRHAADFATSIPYQAEADRYIGYAKRCLELADEQDSLEVLRTMFTLAIIYLAVYKGSEKLASGHRLWPPICAMLLRLGYNRHEPAALTPIQRYERRAIAHAIFCEHLHWCLVYGKRRQLFARDLQVPPPVALRDDELPVELHKSPFRVKAVTEEKHRIWLELALLSEAVQTDFENATVIQHSVVKCYTQKVDELEAQIPSQWRQPAISLTVDSLPDTCAHSVLMAGVRKLRVYLHRPFIAHRKPFSGVSDEDILWHRTEMLRTTKELISVMPTYTILGGPWTAHGYTSMDCIISSLLIALLDPDRPDVQEARSAAQIYVEKNKNALEAPMTVQRLVRLLSLLLVNPRLAEEAPLTTKRPRSSLTGISLGTSTPVTSFATPSDFDFSFSSPLYGLDFDLDEQDVRRRLPVVEGSEDWAEQLLNLDAAEQ